MNERNLSEKLEELARRLEDGHDRHEIAQELRKLSTEKYAPGNSASWKDIAPQKNKSYTDKKTGRKLPF